MFRMFNNKTKKIKGDDWNNGSKTEKGKTMQIIDGRYSKTDARQTCAMQRKSLKAGEPVLKSSMGTC